MTTGRRRFFLPLRSRDPSPRQRHQAHRNRLRRARLDPRELRTITLRRLSDQCPPGARAGPFGLREAMIGAAIVSFLPFLPVVVSPMRALREVPNPLRVVNHIADRGADAK